MKSCTFIHIFQVCKVGSYIYEQGERFILDCHYCTCKGPLYWCRPLCSPLQCLSGTKPIYEDKLVQRTECTCKSKQLGQALKKCFNPNTLPRLQVFICWLSFEREKWHYETKAFSTISALFVNLVLCPLGRCALVPSWLWILCCGFRIFGTGYESSWFFSVQPRIPDSNFSEIWIP